jgi:hypothetical protein
MDTTCVLRDVLLVCRNGHVITDRLHSCPEQRLTHCDRCGATTLDRCPTCGRELPGALLGPGPVPVGGRRPPQYCLVCGAAFPWTQRPRSPSPATPAALLESLLRRVPLVARQLRARTGDRPPFPIGDERDLEDLLRALLPVHFDEIVTESRTPHYDPGTRTDFLLQSGAVALTAKLVRPGVDECRLARQLDEDAAHHACRPGCRTLVCFVYDPQGLLAEPRRLEAVWSRPYGDLWGRCVIG